MSNNNAVSGTSAEPTATNQQYISPDDLLFDELCSVFQLIHTTRGNKLKHQIIQSFFARLNPTHNWYNLLRLLMPNIDIHRNNYGLKEYKIIELYTGVLGLTRHNTTYQQLKQYKNPVFGHRNAKSIGDFTSMLDDVLSQSLYNTTNLSRQTVLDVNHLLDSLYIANASNDKAMRNEIFTVFVTKFTPAHNKWLIRIILNELSLGITAEQILTIYHIYGQKIYYMCTNLRRVCDMVSTCDMNQILKLINNVELFVPFRPMLCSNINTHQLQQLLLSHQYYIENKYDGERLLVHKSNDQVKFFSRNSVDLGEKYHYHTFLSNIVLHALQSINNCIVDCELIAMDKRTGRLIPFGNNRTIVKRKNMERQQSLTESINDDIHIDVHAGRKTIPNMDIVDQQSQLNNTDTNIDNDNHLNPELSELNDTSVPNTNKPWIEHKLSALTSDETVCLKCFDCIYLNDTVLLDTPLRQRTELLHQYIHESPYEFELVEHQLFVPNTSSSIFEQLLGILDTSILNGCEGIVLKDIQSQYILNERGQTWIKIKPDYVDGLRDNFDCIILGGYYGSTTRGNLSGSTRSRTSDISHLLLGCKKSTWNNTTNCNDYYVCGKVGSGYTDNELAELRTKLQSYYIYGGLNKSRSEVAPWLSDWTNMRPDDIPDIYIEPVHSIIIEIKCSELTPCDKKIFNSELTFRFPRVEKIRYDKLYSDCISIHELMTSYIHMQNPTSMSARHITISNTLANKQTGNKRKVSHRPNINKRIRVAAQFLPDRNNFNIIQSDQLFSGQQYCVGTLQYDRHTKHTKQSIESLIIQHGGTITQNPIDGITTAIITNQPNNIRIKTYIQSGRYNILHVNYIPHAIDTGNGRYNQYDDYVIYLTDYTKSQLAHDYDVYGDSFTEFITAKQLDHLCYDSIHTAPSTKTEHTGDDKKKSMNCSISELIYQSNELQYKYNMFCQYTFYLHNYSHINQHNTLVRYIELLDGTASHELTDNTTHVVIQYNQLRSTDYMHSIQQLCNDIKSLRQQQSNPLLYKYIIYDTYITDCYQQQDRLNIKNYTFQFNELH